MAGTKPGPAPKPRLRVVKEGNPSKRPLRPEAKLPPKRPAEPRWDELFPLAGDAKHKAETKRCRVRARAVWRLTVEILDRHGLIAEIDGIALQDVAVVNAQLEMTNRAIAREGLTIVTEHGRVRNPATTAAAQLRSALAKYVANLGLSPAARVGLVSSWDGGGGASGDEDDPFD